MMKNEFGKQLKSLREGRNLSQSELSKTLSVSKQTVSAWEKSLQETDFNNLIKISKYFGVSLDYLLGVEE